MPSKAKLTLGMPSRKKVKEIHRKAKLQKKGIAEIVIALFDNLPDEGEKLVVVDGVASIVKA